MSAGNRIAMALGLRPANGPSAAEIAVTAAMVDAMRIQGPKLFLRRRNISTPY
jgi:hypothetical protein